MSSIFWLPLHLKIPLSSDSEEGSDLILSLPACELATKATKWSSRMCNIVSGFCRTIAVLQLSPGTQLPPPSVCVNS